MPNRDPARAGIPDDLHVTHAIDVPGHGTLRGEIDLRQDFHACLGSVPLEGKRVLDACTLSGFTTFAMEALGADVVSYDRADGRHWDLVPFCDGPSPSHLRPLLDVHQARIARAYRFCHAALGSRAERVEGCLYAIPEAIGPVDVAVVGSLAQIRDPFRALHGALRLVQETAVVTGLLPQHPWFAPSWLARLAAARRDALAFVPRPDQNNPFQGWWRISPATVVHWLEVIGFGETRIAFHRRPLGGRARTFYAVVGRRTRANHGAI
ncbi:hypothetical protein [Methylobacterium nonmethylotrophicum]|uniref:Class I SAM-dependent methyltransferase n=1 Tax=Methylobacterium nonmethylotrophicum TaxID=1141884 RepID=A0A4Z0NJY8_9HYPH|nr:hypothetical protein [Methylobacterium nonmethylotrophicum]TGD95796.1 hypothetical protein EU555_26570 [Methylobacterium nonmethylotrophicum]